MNTIREHSPEVVFPLRRDRNGWRAVYKLGNELGSCPFQCRFCGVRRSPRVTSDENVSLFNQFHAQYLATIDGPYHAAIFNRGNVTSAAEFSPNTLSHVLETFARDDRVTYVSLNARESTATAECLDSLAARELPFPIRFIFGQESFANKAWLLLGKDTRGELERFIAKLRPYNEATASQRVIRRYEFGMNVNLVFLPELYLKPGESRDGNEARIAAGIADDLRQLLARSDPLVPMEVNIHPYYPVESLPYEKADLFMLLRILPSLQRLVEDHNRYPDSCQTHLFVGVVFIASEGAPDDRAGAMPEVQRMRRQFDVFNATGRLPVVA
jgi:hypothetical protein